MLGGCAGPWRRRAKSFAGRDFARREAEIQIQIKNQWLPRSESFSGLREKELTGREQR